MPLSLLQLFLRINGLARLKRLWAFLRLCILFRVYLLHLASKQIPLCSQSPVCSFQHRWRQPGHPSRHSCPVCQPSGGWAAGAWPEKRMTRWEPCAAARNTAFNGPSSPETAGPLVFLLAGFDTENQLLLGTVFTIPFFPQATSVTYPSVRLADPQDKSIST